MPLANAFLTPEQFSSEYFYELKPASCSACGLFQITEQPAPEQMFHPEYAFFTRTSKSMIAHFSAYALWVQSRFAPRFVLEIGCNDGVLLENFARQGVPHLGVEPSANVAAVAEKHGVRTEVAFFGEVAAHDVRTRYGAADVILAANVICHIPDIRGVAAGVAALLSPTGVFVFEEPYLGAMMEKGSYDQIYDEHVFIFSAHSVAALFRPFGLELIECLPQPTHGGSMRYVVARAGARPVEQSVAQTLALEDLQALQRADTYERFRSRCENNRAQLVALVRQLRAKGRRVVGYAATSKSTTVLNYCGLGPDDIEFISDTTPVKQGKFTPGTHIPVRPHGDFTRRYPDFAVLFGWNHEAEILGKEEAFAMAGGRWIRFVPEVQLV